VLPQFAVSSCYHSEPFVTVADEALHGFNCESGNREYCGDISSAKDGELEEQAKHLVKEFLGRRTPSFLDVETLAQFSPRRCPPEAGSR